MHEPGIDIPGESACEAGSPHFDHLRWNQIMKAVLVMKQVTSKLNQALPALLIFLKSA